MWLSEDTLQPMTDVLQMPLFQLSVVTTMLLLSVHFCACVSVLVELTPRGRSAESKECIHRHTVKSSPRFRCD